MAFRNHYYCEECDIAWSDVWDHICNDRCPGCNVEIEPESSDDEDEE